MQEKQILIFNIERFAIHDGPGIRTTVFLKGCPLRCQWCANPESQSTKHQIMFLERKCVGCGTCIKRCPKHAITLKEGKAFIDRKRCICCGVCEEACPYGTINGIGKKLTASDIFQIIIKDKEYYKKTSGGITFSGGEPLLQSEELMPLLKKCQEEKLHIAVETCGCIAKKHIEKVLPVVDLFLFDIKTLNAEKFCKYTGGDLELVLQNFSYIAQKRPKDLVIRVPVISGLNNTKEEILEIYKFALKHQVNRIDLLPYHTLGLTKYQQLGIEYPFQCLESLKKETVIPFVELGESLGLNITIGG